MNGLVMYLLRVLAVTLLVIPTRALLSADDQTFSVCEVLASPAKFNGKIIGVRGVESATDEGAWLDGINCAPLVTKGYTWPATIWIETSGDQVQLQGFNFEELVAAIKRIDRQLEKLCVTKRDKIILTYVGRFHMLQDLDSRVDNYNGTPRGVGLGHANYAPAEIVVKTVKDLSVERVRKSAGTVK